MKFFFSNLPPRNARKPVHQSTETVKMKEKDPSLEKPGPSPAKTRGRGSKRQCISTPENRFAPQDQLQRGSSMSIGSLQVSGLDLPRESVCEESLISVSIPCSNPFELLTTLCVPDQDAGMPVILEHNLILRHSVLDVFNLSGQFPPSLTSHGVHLE